MFTKKNIALTAGMLVVLAVSFAAAQVAFAGGMNTSDPIIDKSYEQELIKKAFTGPYISATAGAYRTDVAIEDFDLFKNDGYTLGVGAGYDFKFSPRIRIGVRGEYHWIADSDDLYDVDGAFSAIVRAGFLLSNRSMFYLGAGYGAIQNGSEVPDTEGLLLLAGLEHRVFYGNNGLFKGMRIGLEYQRLADYDRDIKFEDLEKADFDTDHIVLRTVFEF